MLHRYSGRQPDPKGYLRDILWEDLFSNIEQVDTVNSISPDLNQEVLLDCDEEGPAFKVTLNASEFDSDSPVADYTEQNRDNVPSKVADAKWDLSKAADRDLVVIGTLPDENAIVLGYRSKTPFGPLVNTKELVDHINEHGSCPCPFEDSLMELGPRKPSSCRCGRYYLTDPVNNNAITMADTCPTANDDGLVKVTDPKGEADNDTVPYKSRAFWTLAQHAPSVTEYMEDCQWSDDGAYLWAHNGHYIGLLYHRDNEIVSAIIAFGHRRNGHGTELVEAWAEQSGYDKFDIQTFDRTEQFAHQLGIQQVSPHLH